MDILNYTPVGQSNLALIEEFTELELYRFEDCLVASRGSKVFCANGYLVITSCGVIGSCSRFSP